MSGQGAATDPKAGLKGVATNAKAKKEKAEKEKAEKEARTCENPKTIR